MASSSKVARSKQLKNIGLRLKKARSSKKLSRPDMARGLYLSTHIFSAIEDGERIPTEPILLLLETLFLINRGWLLTGAGEMFIKEDTGKVNNGDTNIIGFIDGYKNLSPGGREKLFKTLQAFLLLEEKNT